MIDREKLQEDIEEIESWVIDIRRDFHSYPELSEQEYRTRDRIREYLDNLGIESRVVADTGVLATIEGRGKGKVVALRADMDALPIEDRKEVSYRSRNKGVMHACGHDVHMAILLGTARLLNKYRDSFKGTVKLIFQPAEETVGGAKPMIEAGVLEDPSVDMVFGLHVDNSIDKGRLGIKYDQMKAASDMINIRVYGRQAHGAYPQDGVDALLVASQIVVALQSVVSRELDPRRSGVVSIGKIKGGYARNIMADYIEMEGIVRTLDEESRRRTLGRIEAIVEGVAQSMGARGELIVDEGYTYLINDRQALEIVESNARKYLGEDSVYMMPYPSYGVEDFAFFAEERPAAFYNLGTGNKKKSIDREAHTDLFDIDEDAIGLGIMMQLTNVLSFLEDGGGL